MYCPHTQASSNLSNPIDICFIHEISFKRYKNETDEENLRAAVVQTKNN